MDKSVILRCYSRIKNAMVNEETKYPIVLTQNSALTALIVIDQHKSVFHAGTNHTLSAIRHKYRIWEEQMRSMF